MIFDNLLLSNTPWHSTCGECGCGATSPALWIMYGNDLTHLACQLGSLIHFFIVDTIRVLSRPVMVLYYIIITVMVLYQEYLSVIFNNHCVCNNVYDLFGNVWTWATAIAENAKHSPNLGTMLAHRLRRWVNIAPTLCKRLVFAGMKCVVF